MLWLSFEIRRRCSYGRGLQGQSSLKNVSHDGSGYWEDLANNMAAECSMRWNWMIGQDGGRYREIASTILWPELAL